MGRHIGPGAVAAVGVFVLLTTGVISPADFVGSFEVLWRPFVAVLSIMLTCPCRKSNPNVLVVQPAQDRAAKNGPGQFDGARDRRILLQR